MKDSSPPDSKIPLHYYQEKKLVLGLGLSNQNICCCANGSMSYNKDDADMIKFMFCNEPHYKKGSQEKNTLLACYS